MKPKIAVIIFLAPFVLAFVLPAGRALASDAGDGGISLLDQELADLYAPVLYFHPDELFRPQPVEVMFRTARLQRQRRFWPDSRVLRHVTPSDLPRYTGEGYYLNAWLWDEASSDYQNYTSHRNFYQSRLSPKAGGPAPLAYAHVVRGEDPAHITVQYWLFYWYNDAFNKHEGDWEMMQVTLTAAGEPEWVVLSQHHGGTRRPWSAAPVEGGTHPVVYVALGSHANYFSGDEVYLNSLVVGNAHVEVADRTGTATRTVPAIALIPDRAAVEADPGSYPGLEWLRFRGHWGEQSPQKDFCGPLGPADKGDQWERPAAWGLAQPLDDDTWYANRLRVEVLGQQGDAIRVTLAAAAAARPATTDAGRATALRAASLDALAGAETLGPVALLHSDPISGTTILANIQALPNRSYDILATWPDAGTGQVIEYRFDHVPVGRDGRAWLTLRPGRSPLLSVAERKQTFMGTAVQTRAAIWDAPDLMWVMGHLPALDVVWGVVLSLLAGLLPTLLYLGVLYWADQYEKEPVRLLAAAFAWGALPALLIAAVLRIFFRVPAGILEPRTVEMVSRGVLAPLVEEALVGAAVLFIAWRHPREFDGVLDGVIYGAVAGLGFAMTANTASYLDAFLHYGFAGLGRTVWIDGLLFGLNRAMYAALFGAGLGYARLARRRWQRRAVPVAALMLAVAIHAFHNLALQNTIGWNLRTVAVTWAGTLVIVGVIVWSIREQRRCLVTELAGQVPDCVYAWLAVPAGGWLGEWHALRRGGPRGLIQVRRVFQLCARLAFKTAGGPPGEPAAAAEAGRLRAELDPLLPAAAHLLARE